MGRAEFELRAKSFLKRVDSQSLILKLPFIFSGVAIGLLSVGFASAAEHATEIFLEFAKRWPYAVFLLTPLAFVISRFIILKFAPAASGSGIPQAMAALEISHKKGHNSSVEYLLGIKNALGKIGSNLIVLIGGAVTGREGPMVQIGASLFLLVGRKLRRFFPRLDAATLIASGGAAGIAAAFNTPLGGIVFAIEELIGEHFTRMRSSMIIAVILAGLVAQSLVGPYLMFGNFNIIIPPYSYIAVTILTAAGLGLLGGVTSKIFMDGQLWISRKGFAQKLWIAAGLGLVLSFLLFFSPRSEHLPGAGIPLIRELLAKDVDVSPWLAVEKWFGLCLTFLSGIAGGFFAPALTVGAICGKLVASLMHSPYATTLILVGMVSLLTALARAPFTALVLVSEMSNGHPVILHLMLASLVSLAFSKFVEKRSYYHFQTEFWLAQLAEKKASEET